MTHDVETSFFFDFSRPGMFERHRGQVQQMQPLFGPLRETSENQVCKEITSTLPSTCAETLELKMRILNPPVNLFF